MFFLCDRIVEKMVEPYKLVYREQFCLNVCVKLVKNNRVRYCSSCFCQRIFKYCLIEL